MICFSFSFFLSFFLFDDRDRRPASIPARPAASLTVPRPARGPPGDVARPPTPRCQSPPSPSPDAHQLASAAVAPPSRRPRSPPVRRPPRRAAPPGPSPPAHQLATAAGPRNPHRCPAAPLPPRSLPRPPCRRPAGRLPQARGPAPGGMVHAHAVGHRRAWTDGARWQSSPPGGEGRSPTARPPTATVPCLTANRPLDAPREPPQTGPGRPRRLSCRPTGPVWAKIVRATVNLPVFRWGGTI